MNLTRESIVTQLCHELVAWKALNLRPEEILGTRDLAGAYELYRKLLGDARLIHINTTDALKELGSYVRNPYDEKCEFVDHFSVKNAGLPIVPYFCATSLFRNAITENKITMNYDDTAQTDLIKENTAFAYPIATGHRHGVVIAAETGNEAMVSFLLHPSLTAFDLGAEYNSLLANPQVTSSEVRKAIFSACGARFLPAMMDGLIQSMQTVDEWIVLYKALKADQPQLLLSKTPASTWTKLNPNETQIQSILGLIPTDTHMTFLTTLLSIISTIQDGALVIRLMDRLSQAERQAFVLKLVERANTVFLKEDHLKACLVLLGYCFDKSSGQLTLNHLHASDEGVVRLVQSLNQQIWTSSLTVQAKLEYFHATQRLLLAHPNERGAAMRAFDQCIDQYESALRDDEDAGLSWGWRMLYVIGRWIGLVDDFPVTVEARKVNRAVEKSPSFNAVILDLNTVILPSEGPESDRRKTAISALTTHKYDQFWSTMKPDEQADLFCNRDRFTQLLQTSSHPDFIERLMGRLTKEHIAALHDLNAPEALLSLLQMPSLPMTVLLGCLGDDRKNSLLRDSAWFGIIMSKLPPLVIKAYLTSLDRRIAPSLHNSLAHIQSALLNADVDRLPYLSQFFSPSIPLTHSPQELGGLIEQLSIEKLSPFWMTFLLGRAFTVAEMAPLLLVVTDSKKRQWLISQWMTGSPSPITAWTDDLFSLLPDMTPAQQMHTLSVMSDDDLRRLIREKKIQQMMCTLVPTNHEVFLERYKKLFTDAEPLNQFLDQLQPANLALWLCQPPYDAFLLLASSNLLQLIVALQCRSKEQWNVLLPRLLDIAWEIYLPSDELVKLLQRVPPDAHAHVLTLLREADTGQVNALFQYLETDIVKALMLHHQLDFNTLTLEGISEMIASAVSASAQSKPSLIQDSDELFHQLIRSHLTEIDRQVSELETRIKTAKTGLLALMIPTMGSFLGIFHSYSYSTDVVALIQQQWMQVSAAIKQLSAHHAELVTFCSIRHYDEAMDALKPIHERIAGLVSDFVIPFIDLRQEPIRKTGLKVTFPVPDTLAIDALKTLPSTLLQIDRDEEARLLRAIPDADLVHKMKTGDELQAFFALIVMPENEPLFLDRCRHLLTTQNLWQELSPSALGLLSKDAPKALFERVSHDSLSLLIRSFRHLTPAQWDALAPNVLALRAQYFDEQDKLLIQVLKNNVSDTAHQHLLHLIRTAPAEKDVQVLLTYLSSGERCEFKRMNEINDMEITIDALPQLIQQTGDWFDQHVKKSEVEIRSKMTNLKTQLSTLIKEWNPPKNKIGMLGFFSSAYTFDGNQINSILHGLSQHLDGLTRDMETLNALYFIKANDSAKSFISALEEDFKVEVEKIKTFMASAEEGQAKLPKAPWCAYRDQEKLPAKECLESICHKLETLAGANNELDLDTTLSSLAAAHSSGLSH